VVLGFNRYKDSFGGAIYYTMDIERKAKLDRDAHILYYFFFLTFFFNLGSVKILNLIFQKLFFLNKKGLLLVLVFKT